MSTNNNEDTQSVRLRKFLAELEGKLSDLQMWVHSGLGVLALLPQTEVELDEEGRVRVKLHLERLEIYMQNLAEAGPAMVAALAEELARYPQPPDGEQP